MGGGWLDGESKLKPDGGASTLSIKEGGFVPAGVSDGALGAAPPFCAGGEVAGCVAVCAPADRTVATAKRTGSDSFKLAGRKRIFKIIR